jgi:hypothetical protein
LFLLEYYDLRNHERDDDYSNTGTLPVFSPGRWQSRTVCGQGILGEWFRSIVLRRDARVEYMERFLPVGGELLFKLLQAADKSLGSESANGIYST